MRGPDPLPVPGGGSEPSENQKTPQTTRPIPRLARERSQPGQNRQLAPLPSLMALPRTLRAQSSHTYASTNAGGHAMTIARNGLQIGIRPTRYPHHRHAVVGRCA
jgi:hypothetical protein